MSMFSAKSIFGVSKGFNTKTHFFPITIMNFAYITGIFFKRLLELSRE